MWSQNNGDMNSPARGFWTPPASWRSPHSPAVAMPLSERRQLASSPNCKRDLFHVIHKVPVGDSPYVRAKHVQIIEKDPSKAVSLFWAAINAGDRVDSALKDMAVVMKQLDRSDEAIEAIKSFRHLCPYESQESIDNVLLELYKRSGRIEEEIEMLQHKLKQIEEGMSFSGKKMKTARSQGRKIQITVEQERSRILGNLAWAYLQHRDYGLAEQHYRKALTLEKDHNKLCNLAICLMHMNRIPEAKSLLQDIKASSGSRPMDDSYAKSFERACQVLAELDSHSTVEPMGKDDHHQRSLVPPAARNLKEVTNSINGDSEYVTGFMNSRNRAGGFHENGRSCWPNEFEKENTFSAYYHESSQHVSFGSRGPQSSLQNAVDCNWRRGGCSYFESPGERSGFTRKTKETLSSYTETEPGFVTKKTFTSPALYTQPRRCSWGFDKGDQRNTRWGDDTAETKNDNVLKHTVRNLSGELSDSTDDHTASKRRNAQENGSQGKFAMQVSNTNRKCLTELPPAVTYDTRMSKASADCDRSHSEDIAAGNKSSINSRRKSWADMVEEEEQELQLAGEEYYLGQEFDPGNYQDEFNDENLDTNIVPQSSCQNDQVVTVSKKLEAFDLEDGYVLSKNGSVSPRNTTARRSLSYESADDVNIRRRNRLQVFQDITPTPDSP